MAAKESTIGTIVDSDPRVILRHTAYRDDLVTTSTLIVQKVKHDGRRVMLEFGTDNDSDHVTVNVPDTHPVKITDSASPTLLLDIPNGRLGLTKYRVVL